MLELISFDSFYHFGKFRNKEVIYGVYYYKSIHDTFLFVNTEYGQNDLYQVNILNYFVYLLYET